ncbi:MAG: dTMP kinase, partial [Chloroflexia bacterium]
HSGPGKLIVIEGLDGAGTTTQAQRIGSWLGKRVPVRVTSEPTDGPVGHLIRKVLKGEVVTDPRALALLFAADRLHHIYGPGGVEAHLRSGTWVVCDRYYLSSLAYQTLDAPFSWVYQINRHAILPHLTVVLRVPVVTCLERIGYRQGPHQELFERREALERVWASYRRAISRLQLQEAIQVVDGTGPIEQVSALVESRVNALFDRSLALSPRVQRRLARRKRVPFLLTLQRALWQEEELSLLGVRWGEEGIEVEVVTPESAEPLGVLLGTGSCAPALRETLDPAWAGRRERVEELARRALAEALYA